MSSNTNDASIVGEAPDEAGPRLKCSFTSGNEDGSDINLSSDCYEPLETYLVQEKGKKSSFLLETPTPTAPSIIVIENETPHSVDIPFFFGGFQLVSTAKGVEIFLTDNEGKETYLMTSKGIPYNKEDTSSLWHKAICVVPGGPRPISKLRMKLLSVSSGKVTAVKLQSLKLTARIAEPMNPTGDSNSPRQQEISTEVAGKKTFGSPAASPSRSHQTSPGKPRQLPGSPGSAPITQSDLGAAMAGLSFLARSTEKGIDEALKEQTNRLEQHVESHFTRMEYQMYSLKSVILAQQQLLQENQRIMQQQQQRIEDQSGHLRELVKHQGDLQVRVQALQADVSILRCQVPVDDDDDDGHHDNDDPDQIDVKVDERRGIHDDFTIGESIPGVVIPLEGLADEETCAGSTSHNKGDADHGNSCAAPVSSRSRDKASVEDTVEIVNDEIPRTPGLLLPLNMPPTVSPENAVNGSVGSDERASEAPGALATSDSSSPQRKYFQKKNDGARCSVLSNIEVTLLEDPTPSQGQCDAHSVVEEYATVENTQTEFSCVGQTHEKKEDDLIEDDPRQFFDSFANQLKQQEQLAVVTPSPSWAAPFQCIPSRAEDSIL
jgi:hypothetical protein